MRRLSALVATLTIAAAGLIVPPAHAAPVDVPVPGVTNDDRVTSKFLGKIAAAPPYWANGSQFYRRTICIDSGWAPYFPYLDLVAADWRAATNNLLIIHVRKALQGCAASGFVQSQRIFFRTYKADDGRCAYAQRYLQPAPNSSYLARMEIFINLQPGSYEICRTAQQYRWVAAHEFGHQALAHETPGVASVMSASTDLSERQTLPQDSPVDGPRMVNVMGNNPA